MIKALPLAAPDRSIKEEELARKQTARFLELERKLEELVKQEAING